MKLLSKIAFFALTLSSQQELTGKDMKSDDYSGLFFTAKAPLHLLLTTPAGKRCGFDALTNSSYNEIPGCGYDAMGLAMLLPTNPIRFQLEV